MRRTLTLCLALGLTLGLSISASAADYEFSTTDKTGYYDSTNYEDLYDSSYNYGGVNQVDYDIPEIQYGLAQDFLESSLNNPYLDSSTQYGLSGSSGSYPELDYGSAILPGGGAIDIEYQPTVTIAQLLQPDGSIGTVSIARVGLYAKVYEDTTNSSMAKGAGHYAGSSCWSGNVGLFGHNRGRGVDHFAELKDVRVGDIVTYKTNQGTRSYEVKVVSKISSTDYSYLNEMGDNRITLITCIKNQPSLRLCVQAVEIR